MCVCVCERERERERERDRQTDRQTQTDRQRDKKQKQKNAVNFPVKVNSHYNTYDMYTMVPQGYDLLSITVILRQDALSVAMGNHTP